MNLSPAMHFTLTRLNTALIQGDDALLASCFEGVDIQELLSQDNLAKVRARGKNAMVIFLASLAVSNDIAPKRAQIWLDCYQSIAKNQLSEGLLALPVHNVLRLTVSAIMRRVPLAKQDLAQCKASHQQWQDAMELAVDAKDWHTGVSLAERLAQKKIETVIWLNISKSLSTRQEFFVDTSGIAQTDIDYIRLARLYELCANAAKNARALDVARSLSYLRAKSLEVAGEYGTAIQYFRSLAVGKNYNTAKIDIARCLCKSGDIPSAITELDDALKHQKCSESSPAADIQLQAISEPDRPVEKKFNVANASKALGALATIFKDNDLKFFLVSGTLLGYEREGKLLDHDKDIDVGVIGWEKQYDICMALQSSALFTVSPHFLKGHKSYYIPIRHNLTGIWIDLFVYHEIDDKLVTGVDFFFGYRQTFAFTPFELKPVNFLGVDMFVPSDADLNLQENFGNWRVPDASYLSHLESPSTTDKGGMPHMLTARIHALGYILKKQPVKVRKVIEIMRQYSQSPWAMSEDLLQHLAHICDQLERSQAPLAPTMLVQELAHA
jgi:tetratricopeptide (TPR) repeat protein